MKTLRGGVTAPKGFSSSGLRAGVKRWSRDLGLLYSEKEAVAAGVFTQNRIQAAPLQVTREHLRGGKLQAVIVNSGNANCCTGKKGLKDAKQMTMWVAQALGISSRKVAVCSTGSIGVLLPMTRIERKIPSLVSDLSKRKHLEFAEAILTTDKKIKETAVRVGPGILGAVCKGAGMIQPNMATMLCFLTTDLAVERGLLQSLLKSITQETFNRITVDGDMSTNDTVLLLANGLCGHTLRSPKEKLFKQFEKALWQVMAELAFQIVKDGEGATHVAHVKVEHAKTEQVALRVCQSVANSNLVKTALFGRDANWGRIAASAGASGASFNPERLSISLGGLWCYKKGVPLKIPPHRLKAVFRKNPLPIRIDLGSGRAEASMLTCDLTDTYVRFNANYRT